MNKKIWDGYNVAIKQLSEDDGGGYLATFIELGRMITGLGETRDEAIEDLQASLPALEASFEENGEDFPKPEVKPDWDEFSGRVTLRLPKMLHAQLDRQSNSEGVSLNSYLVTILQSAATARAAGLEFGAVQRNVGSKSNLYLPYGDFTESSEWLNRKKQQSEQKLPDNWMVLEEA